MKKKDVATKKYQIKLRTFFIFIFIFLVTIGGSCFVYTHFKFEQESAHITEKRILAITNLLKPTLLQIASSGKYDHIRPAIESTIKNRPYLRSISFSQQNRILLSSDQRLVGNIIPAGIFLDEKRLVSDIQSGEEVFLIPFYYVSNAKEVEATIVLELVSPDLFMVKFYHDSIIVALLVTLLFGILFYFIYRHFLQPIEAIRSLILKHKVKNNSFLIHDFTTLYNHLSVSYAALEEKEKSLESVHYLKDYLYEILHTIDIVNRLLISDKSIQNVMRECCDLLAQHGHYRLAWIGNVVNERIEIVAHSDDPTGYIEQLSLSLDPADPTSRGPSAQSILANKTIITPSINIEAFSLWHKKAKDSGFGSSITLPLRGSSDEQPFGTLAIYSSKSFGFHEEEIRMLEDLAGDIGYIITSRRRQEALRHATMIDSLTGLPCRAPLIEALCTLSSPHLLVVNINRFRDVNSVYGFATGDCLLREFASCITHFASKGDQVYRLHGDTFVILLGSTHTAVSAQNWINTYSEYLSNHPFKCGEIELWISLTAGYADTMNRVIENAEIALKSAKIHKLPFFHFHPSLRLNEEHQENITWYKIIKDAILEGRIVPYFQGIANNTTEKIDKYEALIRLIMPDGTVISPYKFLDIAIRTGLYPKLTKIMVQKTIAIFRDLPYTVSLNLSTEDISNADMVSFLYDTLFQASIGKKIIFEILESEGIYNYDQVIEFIDTFKRLGCRFAIDDFGSGFSNYGHLIKLQVDFLKIDSSLIKNLPHDKNAQVIVQSIQNFAAEMGLKTIAEFVSSEEIYRIVKSMGITYSQGYYFSEPSAEILHS
ncbi:MAG: GGDEF domain-containing protein [Campylobacterales bacterium]|nr:GGDEF domain-containing protein [Campylobacterales bacterium]